MCLDEGGASLRRGLDALPAELAQTFADHLTEHRWLAEQFDDWIDQEVAKLDAAWPEGELKAVAPRGAGSGVRS